MHTHHMSAKRSYYEDALPVAKRTRHGMRTLRETESPMALLPHEMYAEIVHQLLLRGPTAYWDDDRTTAYAVCALRRTCHALHLVVDRVMRTHWRDAFLALKHAMRDHNWREPLLALPRLTQHMGCMVRMYETANVPLLTQWGGFIPGLLRPMNDLTLEGILSHITVWATTDRTANARARWARLRPVHWTMANTFEMTNASIEYPTWGPILRRLFDAWFAHDVDEALAYWAWWLHRYQNALYQEAEYVKTWWVLAVLHHKLGLEWALLWNPNYLRDSVFNSFGIHCLYRYWNNGNPWPAETLFVYPWIDTGIIARLQQEMPRLFFR